VICPSGWGWTCLSGGSNLTGLLLLRAGDGHLLEVLDQIGHIVVTGIGGRRTGCAAGAVLVGNLRGQLLQLVDVLGAQLRQDSGDHLGDRLVLAMTRDGERVRRKRGLGLRVVEVDDGAIVLDDVHLLDAGDRVHRQLLQGRLQLLVVGGGRGVDNLLLAAGGSLAANAHLRLQLLQLLRIHLPNGIHTKFGLVTPQSNAVQFDIYFDFTII